MTILVAAVVLLAATVPVAAHGDDAVWTSAGAWSYDPWLVVPLYLGALLYLLGTRRVWREAGAGRGISYWHAASFWAGWTILALALISPLHFLAERMLSAHMLEHELIMAVAAPLLVLSKPLYGLLWALPIGARKWLGAAALSAPVAAVWVVLTDATIATGLHAFTVLAWHVPLLFEAATENPVLHKLQHASFLVTALLFWWSLLKLPRRAYGVAAFDLFATMMAFTMLGALLTLSPKLWYPSYSAPLFGLSPLEDQQLAGLLMWIPGCSIYAAAALGFFAVWITTMGPRGRPDAILHRTTG